MSSSDQPTTDHERAATPEGTIAGPSGSTRVQSNFPVAPAGAGHQPPSAGNLAIGDTLAGYRLLQKLGEGGMGAVYMAEDIALRRQVALKVMKKEIATSESSKQRFFREARAAARLQHDNVVGIHQIGEEFGIPFLAMPLLKGESLGKRLQREAALPIPTILNLGRDIADGLSAAHEMGLVHRDIKPDNIWVEPLPKARGERAKILDFGLVRQASEDDSLVTQQGAVLGTPAYMSPEQACGMEVDHRSDLFSLGGVLYKMATGRRPFNGRNAIEVLSNLATETPPTPASLVPGMLPELSDLIMKLLEKEPKDRPASAQEVAEIFRTLQPEGMVVVVRSGDSGAPWAIADAESDVNSLPTDNVTLPDSRKLARSATPPPKRHSRSGSQTPMPLPALPQPKRRFGIGFGVLATLLTAGIVAGVLLWAKSGRVKDSPTEPEVASVPPPPVVEVVPTPVPPPPKKVVTFSGPEIGPPPRLVVIVEPEIPLPYPREVKPVQVVIEPPKKKDPPIDIVVIPKKKDPPKDVVVDKSKVVGNALQFGQGSAVLVPSLKLDRAGPFTFEAYVTPSDKNLAGMNAIVWIPGQTALAIPFSFWSFTAFPEGATAGLAVKVPVKEQKRTHVAAVRNDKQILLFLNGKLVGSRDCPNDKLAAPKDVLMIGANPGAMKISSFDGLIDEIRISKRARYSKDFVPQPRFETDRDTLGLYHFDEGQGDILNDATNNEHHGNIIGAKWVKSDGSPIVPFDKSGTIKNSDRPKGKN